ASPPSPRPPNRRTPHERCPDRRLPGQQRFHAIRRIGRADRRRVRSPPRVGRVGIAHGLCRLGGRTAFPTSVPRCGGALRRPLPGADLLPALVEAAIMNRSFRFFRLHRIASLTALPARAVLAPLAQAQGLPTLEDPSRGTGSGIMETLRNYGYDIVMLIALLVVASMFVGVCYHAYTRYAEIHTGRATWGQFGLSVAVGAILLVVGIWLLTEATGIL